MLVGEVGGADAITYGSFEKVFQSNASYEENWPEFAGLNYDEKDRFIILYMVNIISNNNLFLA